MAIDTARALKWLMGPDVGASSKAMLKAAMGDAGYMPLPMDAADFGRCYRMLAVVGSEDEILAAAAKADPQRWGRLVKAWPALVTAYRRRDYPLVGQLIRESTWVCAACKQVVNSLSIRDGGRQICFDCERKEAPDA